VASRFEAEKTRSMGCCEPFTDVVPALERLAAAGVPVLLCSSTRLALVREFCERHGLLERFASVDGWRPRHAKSAQLASAVAAAGIAAHEVIFVGDTRRDGDVARAAGTRFVGLVRAGHPDALAGSGANVVGSLSELAADLDHAARSPLTRAAPECEPALPRPIEPGRSGFEGEERAGCDTRSRPL
jgi:phosphoglycolate phosphatase-like HAD superfamily hydrolase